MSLWLLQGDVRVAHGREMETMAENDTVALLTMSGDPPSRMPMGTTAHADTTLLQSAL